MVSTYYFVNLQLDFPKYSKLWTLSHFRSLVHTRNRCYTMRCKNANLRNGLPNLSAGDFLFKIYVVSLWNEFIMLYQNSRRSNICRDEIWEQSSWRTNRFIDLKVHCTALAMITSLISNQVCQVCLSVCLSGLSVCQVCCQVNQINNVKSGQ